MLAPTYNVLNTAAHWKVKVMDRRVAMEVGGESRPAYVRRRPLDQMFADHWDHNHLDKIVVMSLKRAEHLAEAIDDKS